MPAIFGLAISQGNFDECDVSGVLFATYGGAPIAPDLVRQVKESFPNASVGNGFGLSETSSVATFLRTSTPRRTPTRSGFRHRWSTSTCSTPTPEQESASC